MGQIMPIDTHNILLVEDEAIIRFELADFRILATGFLRPAMPMRQSRYWNGKCQSVSY